MLVHWLPVLEPPRYIVFPSNQSRGAGHPDRLFALSLMGRTSAFRDLKTSVISSKLARLSSTASSFSGCMQPSSSFAIDFYTNGGPIASAHPFLSCPHGTSCSEAWFVS
jgi:hypothetical protein